MSDSSSSRAAAPATAALPATVWLIAVGAFALGMASYVTAGLMPLIASAFSISLAMAAQLVTAFTLAYGLGSPLVVALLPARAQRCGLLLALGVFVLANGASALAPGFAGLLAWRAMAGIGAGVYLALGIAAAAGVSAPQQRGKAIGVIMGGMAGGTVLGVPLSLLLAQQLGWTAALWLVAVLGALALAGLLWKLPALPEVPATSLRRKLALLADGQVLLILLVSLLAAVASLGMYTFIAPLLAWSAQGTAMSATPFLWAWGVGGDRWQRAGGAMGGQAGGAETDDVHLAVAGAGPVRAAAGGRLVGLADAGADHVVGRGWLGPASAAEPAVAGRARAPGRRQPGHRPQ